MDHLVGAQEQRWRNAEPELLRSCKIDHQFELSWLLDWQITGLGTFEYLVDISSSAVVHGRMVRAIGQEQAELWTVAALGDADEIVLRCEDGDRAQISIEKRVVQDDHGIGVLADKRFERGLDLFRTPHLERMNRDAKAFRRRFRFLELDHAFRNVGIPEQRHVVRIRQDFPKDLKTLCAELGRERSEAGDPSPRARQAVDETAANYGDRDPTAHHACGDCENA